MCWKQNRIESIFLIFFVQNLIEYNGKSEDEYNDKYGSFGLELIFWLLVYL